MTILLDAKPLQAGAELSPDSTLGDALNLIQQHLEGGKIIVKVELDGQPVDGSTLTLSRSAPLAGHHVAVSTADQKQLALATIGKLAALIEWLAPQHAEIAAALEKGQTAPALQRLGGVLSAWQQIQQSYAGLMTLLQIKLEDVPVRDLTAADVIAEFCKQLTELQTALQNQDFVLLGDILQYEMEGAVKNWMSLLEAALGVVQPE